MRKIRFKQAVAFVVFLLSVAAMDSRLYITAGVLAIASAIYMYSTVQSLKPAESQPVPADDNNDINKDKEGERDDQE